MRPRSLWSRYQLWQLRSMARYQAIGDWALVASAFTALIFYGLGYHVLIGCFTGWFGAILIASFYLACTRSRAKLS